MNQKFTIQSERTTDGSQTLYIPELDEHYHSVKGAVTESLHVYVGLGLRHMMEQANRHDPIRVFEVGFGTGLNALLTLEMAIKEEVNVSYSSSELYPLAWEDAQTLAYGAPEMFKRLHAQPWNEVVELHPRFTLHKMQGDVLAMQIPEADVVYFDAFAPEKQPEMWSAEIFARIYRGMHLSGVLTTYCAKGAIRRLLQATGFTVERLAGPVGGKREILRAVKR